VCGEISCSKAKRFLLAFYMRHVFIILAIVFVIGGLYLGVSFGYPLYQKSNESCLVDTFLSAEKVNCGYVMTDREGTRDYYAGYLEKIKKVGNKYYMWVDLGNKNSVKFLILDRGVDVSTEAKQNEIIKNDDLLKIETNNRPITLSVRTGSRFLEYVKSAQDDWPSEGYEYVLTEAEKQAKCDPTIMFLMKNNYLPLIKNCEISPSEIYL